MTVLLESIDMYNAFSSLQFPLTALLGNIDLHVFYFHGIKFHGFKCPPALCWHSTPAYYAFCYVLKHNKFLPI